MVIFFNNCKVLNWSFIGPVSSMSQIPVKDLCFASFGKVFGSSDSYVGNLGVVQGSSKRKESSEFFHNNVAVTTIFDGRVNIQRF